MTTLNTAGESLYLFCFVDEDASVEFVDLKVVATVKYLPEPVTLSFTESSSKHLLGNEFCQDEGIDYHELDFPFTVSSVRGHVKWQHHGSDFLPVLRLKRLRSRKPVAKLRLAQFDAPRSKGYSKFAKEPDAKDLFWQIGRTGSMFVYTRSSFHFAFSIHLPCTHRLKHCKRM